ncbi:MAG TPA: oxidoreductase [Pyrinomonadaceae bacterium]|jgi:uncharacterized protein YbjT (DUF2867 family)|nr:oxidoreductase [Pyrinomonadaceae bacterium]
MRTALLLGATGLVGGHCLELLLNDSAYGKVIVLGRKQVSHEHAKLEQHVIDFEHLPDFASLMRAEDVFSCLGTTIKKAGSKENFRRVDFTYQYETARLASEQGAKQLLLVSALGADPRSSIFYNRVKGELEQAVSKLTFDAVNIFRPSLLLGERAEFRLTERVAELPMRYVSFLMVGPLAKYRPVTARAVAASMLKIAKQQRTGINVFESDQIRRMTDDA